MPDDPRHQASTVDEWRLEKIADLAATKATVSVVRRLGINPDDDASVERFQENQRWVTAKRTQQAEDFKTLRKSALDRLMTGLGVVLLAGLTALGATMVVSKSLMPGVPPPSTSSTGSR